MDDTKKNIFIDSSSSYNRSFVGNHCLRTVTVVHLSDGDVIERATQLLRIIEVVENIILETCNDTPVHILNTSVKNEGDK